MIVTENNTKMKRDETKIYRYSKKKVEKKFDMNCRPCKKCDQMADTEGIFFFEIQETGSKWVKGEKIMWDTPEEKENTM